MWKEKPNQLLVIATWALVIVTIIFGWRQNYSYETSVKIENRAYVSVIEPRMDSLLNQATFTIRNFGKTPAYRIEMGIKFVRGDTLIYDPNEFPLDTSWFGFSLVPEFSSVHYVKFIPSSGKRLFLYGKIHYTDRFDEWHFTSFGFEYEFRTGSFQLHRGFNDAN